jgi:hypothetical protein
MLPEPSADGRPEKPPRREIVNAILYVVRPPGARTLLGHGFVCGLSLGSRRAISSSGWRAQVAIEHGGPPRRCRVRVAGGGCPANGVVDHDLDAVEPPVRGVDQVPDLRLRAYVEVGEEEACVMSREPIAFPVPTATPVTMATRPWISRGGVGIATTHQRVLVRAC